MRDAECLGHPSDRSGVPATVHILVHLLRHLLRVTKVCCGDSDSAEGGAGQGKTATRGKPRFESGLK